MPQSYATGAGASTSTDKNGHAQTKGRPPRPQKPPPPVAENIPEELKARPYWIVWGYHYKEKEGKWDKPPMRPDLSRGPVAHDEPANAMPFDEAMALYRAYPKVLDGIGYLIGQDPDLFAVDLDGCLVRDEPEEDGDEPEERLMPWAESLLDLYGSYTERSPSGLGLRVIARGKRPGFTKKIRAQVGPHAKSQTELFVGTGYVTITGNHVTGEPKQIVDRQHELDALVDELTRDEAGKGPPPPKGDGKGFGWSDVDVLRLARAGCGNRRVDRFVELYDQGDLTNANGNHSTADYRLCIRLAFYTGRDPDQIDRLYQLSALCRDKWDERRGATTYGRYTIDKVLTKWGDRDFFDPRFGPLPEGMVIPPLFVPADPTFANFSEKEVEGSKGKTGTIRLPLRMTDITGNLSAITGGWPKRVGSMLFVEGGDGKPHWLDSSPKLFAWIDRKAKVNWTKGGAYITQERFYEDLKVNVEAFDAIEVCPHFPPMPRTYYMHTSIGTATGKLQGLINFFKPASKIDRNLIEAFIITLLWGGSPGRRPAFLLTGPDVDSQNGRGVGKSTFVEILTQELVGGFVEVPPAGDMEAVKTRLLSPGAAFLRGVRLDNVKTLRFSWAELEALITAGTISGKRLYQGEGSRLNTLVWAITVNGESLSEDLAQRCVHIKVKRPDYSPTWETGVRRYVRENLTGLWADVKHAIENAARDVEASGRWAEWECGVLAATPDPAETQMELILRRDAMNADRRESGDFRYYVSDQLKELGYDPQYIYVFIASLVMGEWLDRAERKHYATNQASARIRGFGIVELTKHDGRDKRGWHWRGAKHDGKGEPAVIDMDRAFPTTRFCR